MIRLCLILWFQASGRLRRGGFFVRVTRRWPQISSMILLVLFLFARPGGTEPVHGVFSEELDKPLYNCTLALRPTAHAATLQIRLEDDGKDHGLRLLVSRQAIVVEEVAGRQTRQLTRVEVAITPDATYQCTVMRRGDWLALAHGDTLLYRGEVARGSGNRAVVMSGKGWSVTEARVQPLEPVIFADDFMRTQEDNGAWTISSGQWQLTSAWDEDPRGGSERFNNATYAQNPFSWAGHGDKTPAWCLAGKPFWEDYTFTAAMKPPVDGAAGIAVNMTSPGNGLLVRWTPLNDHSPRGDRLCLLRVQNGQETELAQDHGGYLPGQWYQLQVVNGLGGIRVLVDGRQRLAVENVTPWHGGIGLYVEGSHPATFDDVKVYGRTLRTDLISERQQAKFNERFQHDKAEMKDWAAAAKEWLAFPGTPAGFLLHRWCFFGDARLTSTLLPHAGTAGQLSLLLHNDGISTTSGYRALIRRLGTGKTAYALYRDAQLLTQTTGDALKDGEEYGIRFQQAGDRLQLEVDGVPVAQAIDPHALTGCRTAYCGEGCFAEAKDPLALGRNVLDYSFDDAPVDWLAEGTWMPTTRWSCTPHWSYLGGWSHGDAVLWHKQRFTGDQSLEAFMAMKMEYPHERQVSADRFRDFCVTICGDGHNPRSGYTGIYGAPGLDGRPNRRTVLLRDGIEVAAVDQPAIDYQGGGHTAWFDLTLHKRGAAVEFWTMGQRVLSYTDPHPLDGGVPAIWTSDNGIALARARLAFANPPLTRTDPHVMLDEPWTPEWVDAGAKLTLDFPRACATTGNPVQLHINPRTAPPTDKDAVSADGSRVTFTPHAIGEHWYQVTAGDGQVTSPAFDLAVHVFNPARGRDDSHAVVLYRFTEGQGQTAHDLSKIGPPIDLTFPADGRAQWLPGQGMHITGPCALTSGTNTKKLADALKRAHAGTFEFWLSFDTLFPPVDWLGCLLAWQQANDHRNLAIVHMYGNIFMTRAAAFTPRYGEMAIFDGLRTGLRTGLQHVVITWDGTTLLLYRNGQQVGRSTWPWRPETWSDDAQLILGNLTANPRCANYETTHFLHIANYIFSEQHGKDYTFLGSYYLVAIHDRCFTQTEIQRHFEVGPSAK